MINNSPIAMKSNILRKKKTKLLNKKLNKYSRAKTKHLGADWDNRSAKSK